MTASPNDKDGGAEIINQCFDERGIPFEEFDVIRVLHFIAARRREKIYMYKQVRLVEVKDGPRAGMHLYGVHLTTPYDPAKPVTNAYYLGRTGERIKGTRIVESPNWQKLRLSAARLQTQEGSK